MHNHFKVKRFLLYAIGLYLAWFFIYDLCFSSIDLWLVSKITEASVWTLTILGYDAHSYPIGYSIETAGLMIQINRTNVVSIGPACNGIVLMALFMGFIVAFPGPTSKKIVFITVGLALINLLNILRIVGLALNSLYHYQSIDFNHKYTFTLILYTAVFFLWMIWVKRYSGINNDYVATSAKSPKSQTA